ncbi:hypothetical protein [Paraburkholderia diazotrophica]|uniref:hypothetical protein n=1 Tax=Paraburkholderia diazotrophica TaxID=667676 RepID=UPI003D1692D2
MNRRTHSKKEVESALGYAEENGWRVVPGTGCGHAWGRMYCPYNDSDCRCGEFCIASIWCTPRNAVSHARTLRRIVENCAPHRHKVISLHVIGEAKRRARAQPQHGLQQEQQEQQPGKDKEQTWNTPSH